MIRRIRRRSRPKMPAGRRRPAIWSRNSVGGDHFVAFLFEKHDMGLEEIDFIVGPEDCGSFHFNSLEFRVES